MYNINIKNYRHKYRQEFVSICEFPNLCFLTVHFKLIIFANINYYVNAITGSVCKTDYRVVGR